MTIFCVVPAYNEERNIETTIKKITPMVDFVIVVNDCSGDNTGKILKNIKNEKLKIIEHPINLGQGAALQTGNEYSLRNGADIIVHFDGDGQFIAEDIRKMTEPILNECFEMTIGSRFMDIKFNIPWFKKNIIMPLAKNFNYIFFGIKTSDPQNGFRAMNKKTAQIIIIENDRMAHCTEILAKAFKHKIKIKEVPIKVLYHEFGQNFSGGFKIIKDLFFNKISN